MDMGTVVALIKGLAPKADPAVIEQAVTDWLDDHPEATTTVQDGSITEEKLAADVVATLTNMEIDMDGKANVIVNRSSGNIATVDDAVQANAVDVVCYINPVQAGVGDPSPSNIRAISGHTGLTFITAEANLISDEIFAENFIKNADGGWDYAKSTYANVYGTKVYENTGTDRLVITYKCKYTNASKTGLFLKIYYTNGTSENVLSGSTVISNASKTVDYISWTYSSNVSTVNTLDITIQIEKYPTVSITEVTWQNEAGTVYGGYLDIVSGLLAVTDGYIASYAGETLPSTWISDRDVYEEGTTPTTGAQVVYKLAEAIVYTLDQHQMVLSYGINNLWHNANGKTELTYRADTKKYIDKNEKTDLITMYITPEMYGAIGNGVADDRSAILDACEAAYKSSKTVLFQNKMYYSSAPIVIEDVPDIEMNGTLKFNNGGNGLTLGKSSASTVEKHIRVNIVCDNQTTGSEYFGFKMLNAINCNIVIDSIKGFCYGFIIAGDTRGCAYNTVNVNVINSIDKSVIMVRTDENSFNSENIFIGGRYVQSSNDDVAIEVQGSNNVFLAPCMEYAAHSLVFINANKNRVISCRTEHSIYAAKFVGTCDFNDVEVGYGAYAVDGFSNLSIVRYNEGVSMDAVGTTVASAFNNNVYDAGYLASKVNIDSTISLEEPLWSLSANTGELYRDGISSSYFVKAGNELEIIGGCIGVVVDCTLTKEFAVYQNGSTAGKVIVKLYDENGDELDMSEISIGPFTDYRDYFGGVLTYGNLPFSKILLPPEAKSAYIGFMAIAGTSLLTFAIRSRTMTIVIP